MILKVVVTVTFLFKFAYTLFEFSAWGVGQCLASLDPGTTPNEYKLYSCRRCLEFRYHTNWLLAFLILYPGLSKESFGLLIRQSVFKTLGDHLPDLSNTLKSQVH